MKNIKELTYLLTLLVLISCKEDKNENLDVLRNMYNAKSRVEHLSYLSEDYELHFGGIGDKPLYKSDLEDMLKWDYGVIPDRAITKILKQDSDTIVINSHEENGFSKILGYPGWDSKNTFVFDKMGLIKLQIYVPLNEESYKKYLEPALDWLKENDSLELQKVYDLENKSLIQDSISGVRWLALLKKWKQEEK